MKAKKSVLAKQRPKRKTKSRRVLFFGFGIASLFAVAVIGYFFLQKPTYSGEAPVRFTLQINVEGDNAVPAAELQAIKSLVQASLKQGTESQLRDTARAVQGAHNLERATVARSGEHQVVVNILPRQPYMRIDADIQRLLTSSGVVYGKAEHEHAGIPVLSGIFLDAKLKLKSDRTLGVSDEEQKMILEGLGLARALREHQLEFQRIVFDRDRGFNIEQGELTVALGRAPFDAQLDRLREILDDLKKNGRQAHRIELDYDGKAFIKVQNM